jgi:DNA-binding MarR family transcriptional regulator
LIMSTNMPRKSPDQKNATQSAMAAEDVFDSIHSVMHLYRLRQYQSTEESGISHLDGKALRFFANHPGSTLKDLSVFFGRDKGQLARLVNGLKRRGFLKSQVDGIDRRQVRLSLSKEGASAQAQLRIKTSQLADQAVNVLSAQERTMLLELIEKIKLNLNSN